MKKDKRAKTSSHARSSSLERMVRRIKPAAKWEDLSYPKTMLTRLRKSALTSPLARALPVFSSPRGALARRRPLK